MVCIVAHRAFHGVVPGEFSRHLEGCNENLRCAVANTALTRFHCASQFLHPARFKTDVLPALVQGLLHLHRDIDDLRGRDDIVPAMDESIKNLVEPKAVFAFAIFVEIADFAPM